jgi:hypothetical protein
MLPITKWLLRSRSWTRQNSSRQAGWEACYKSKAHHTLSSARLDVIFTTEFLHQGGGLLVPIHLVVTAPHHAGRSKTCRRATKAPKFRHTLLTRLVHSKNRIQGSNTLLSHSLGLSLALITLKLVLIALNDQYEYFVGLDVFLMCMNFL